MIDFLALYTLKGVSVKLLKETKSLQVTISGLECDGQIDWKVIRSLRQIFNWTHQHLEVESVIIKNRFNEFNGHNLDKFKDSDSSEVLNYFKEYQELLSQILKSPQYIILDMGNKFASSILDLAFVADYRVSQDDCELISDISENCIIPSNTMTTLGSHLFGQSFIKDLCLNQFSPRNQMMLFHICQNQYKTNTEGDNLIKRALQENLKRSAVIRIQTKSLLYSEIENQLNYSFQKNLEYLNASLIGGEFLSNISGLFERANPRELKPHTHQEERSSHLRSV